MKLPVWMVFPMAIVPSIMVSAAYPFQRIVGPVKPSQELIITQSAGFPVRQSKKTELGDHRHMKTSIIVSNNGRIDGTTRIWTDKKWEGFTGCSVVLITDSVGNILFESKRHRYGVDGVNIPGKSSDRTQKWNDQIPPNILPNARGSAIFNGTCPKDRWPEIWNDAAAITKKTKEIFSSW
ncbi:MAG: hypothetical protein WCP63_03660 [Cyanobium sp. ELA712]